MESPVAESSVAAAASGVDAGGGSASMRQLLEEVRQLCQDQAKLVEVMKKAFRIGGEEQGAEQPMASRLLDGELDTTDMFWAKIFPLDQSGLPSSNFNVFVRWFRNFVFSDLWRGSFMITAPELQLGRALGSGPELLAPSMDFRGEERERIEKVWPRSIESECPMYVDAIGPTAAQVGMALQIAAYEYRAGDLKPWAKTSRLLDDNRELHHYDPRLPWSRVRPQPDALMMCVPFMLLRGHVSPQYASLLMRFSIASATWMKRSRGLLHFEIIARIFGIAQRSEGGFQYNLEEVEYNNDPIAHNFLAMYTSHRPAGFPRFQAYIQLSFICLQFHLRYFIARRKEQHKVPGLYYEADGYATAGMRCNRDDGELVYSGVEYLFTERRSSFSMSSSPTARNGAFAILVLDDFGDAEKIVGNDALQYGGEKSPGVDQLGLRTCPHLTGVIEFQRLICISNERWAKEWASTLFEIDRSLSVQARDVLDPKLRGTLMYDNTALQRSEFYFTLLQLLRVFSLAIMTAMDDLKNLAEESRLKMRASPLVAGWDNLRGDEGVQIIEANWDVVLSRQRKAGDTLLERISRKADDIKSLRDGLFSAQSVREAIKSTQINQYLLVFTVVTILYLPPTFVATFYGMHLFDSDDGTPTTQHQFWTMFGVVSGITYLIAAALLSSVDRAKDVRRWIKESLWSVRNRYSEDLPGTTGVRGGSHGILSDGGPLSSVRGIARRAKKGSSSKEA